MPALANGIRSLPLSASPSLANKYVPCSVASEHLAAAASGAALPSAANTFPAPARAKGSNVANAAMRTLIVYPPVPVETTRADCRSVRGRVAGEAEPAPGILRGDGRERRAEGGLQGLLGAGADRTQARLQLGPGL